MGVFPEAWRIALVEPPYLFWDRSMDRLRQTEESIPGFGMLVLAAVARERGHEVALFDAKGSGETPAHVAERILAFRPDVVGFSATTISIANAGRIAEIVKESDSRIRTVVGGPHVSAIPERTLAAFPALDYGIVGEGEISFFELIERLRAGRSIDDAPGLVYRANERSSPTRARRTSTISTRCRCRPGTSCPDSRTAFSRRSSAIARRRSPR